MPHIWNNIPVVTADEILPHFDGNMNRLKVQLERDKSRPHGMRKVQRGGNGRTMLIAYDSLPEVIKNTLADPTRMACVLQMFWAFDADAAHYFQQFQFDDGSYLSQRHREQYITNASVLTALLLLKKRHLEVRHRSNKPGQGKLWTFLHKESNTFKPVLKKLEDVEHTLPDSLKRFKQTLIAFEKDGYSSLVSKKHRNTNSRKVTDEVMDLLNSLFAGRDFKPNRTEVAREYDAFLSGYIQVVSEETGELIEPKGFKRLSEATIINWLGKWENKIGTYAKRGTADHRQGYIGKFRTPHKMEKGKYAGSLVSIDDRQPPFTWDGKQRPWLYLGSDLLSEVVTTWVHGPTKEGIIVPFYQQMVRNHAEWGLCLPAELECEAHLNANFKDGLLREGNMFQYVHIAANNARAKIIERRIGLFREEDRKKPGFISRPFAKRETDQGHAIGDVKQYAYEDLIKMLLMDIQNHNNGPHSKYPEMSRWEFHLKHQNPNLKPINWHGILPFIGHRTVTTVRTGQLRLNGGDFLLGDLGQLYHGQKLINLMNRLEGNEVVVRWLDGNDGEVLKAHIYLGDQYMGEAISKPSYNRARVERTEEDNLKLQAMAQYVATVDAFGRDRKKQIDRVLVMDSRPKTVSNTFKIRDLDVRSFDINPDVEVLPDPVELDDIDAIPNRVTPDSTMKNTF